MKGKERKKEKKKRRDLSLSVCRFLVLEVVLLALLRTRTEGFLDGQPISMGGTVVPGLEVAPSASLQVVNQPDEDGYCIRSERWNRSNSEQSGHSDSDQPSQSNNQSQITSQSLVKIIRVLVMTIALSLAVALGVGLSAKHKPKSSK